MDFHVWSGRRTLDIIHTFMFVYIHIYTHAHAYKGFGVIGTYKYIEGLQDYTYIHIHIRSSRLYIHAQTYKMFKNMHAYIYIQGLQ